METNLKIEHKEEFNKILMNGWSVDGKRNKPYTYKDLMILTSAYLDLSTLNIIELRAVSKACLDGKWSRLISGKPVFWCFMSKEKRKAKYLIPIYLQIESILYSHFMKEIFLIQEGDGGGGE